MPWVSEITFEAANERQLSELANWVSAKCIPVLSIRKSGRSDRAGMVSTVRTYRGQNEGLEEGGTRSGVLVLALICVVKETAK